MKRLLPIGIFLVALLAGCHQDDPDNRLYVYRNDNPVVAAMQIDGDFEDYLYPGQAGSYYLNKLTPHRIDVTYGQFVPMMTPQGVTNMWQVLGMEPAFNIFWTDEDGWHRRSYRD